MRWLLYPLLSIGLLSCSDDLKECLETRIEQFQTDQADCPGASIIKYRFQEDELYGFTDGQCISDGATSLIDKDCNSVCLIGGIAALTDCDGINFANNSEILEVIWQN